MNYLQARCSLGRIVQFRDLYVKLREARTSTDSQTVQQVSLEMARLASHVQHDFVLVDMGYMTLQDAPLVGGQEHTVELAPLVYNIELATRYNFSERDVVLLLERAIGEYLRLRSRAFWNLFNPLWWIREILAGIVSIPFYVIGLAGFDQEAIESSLVGRLLKLLAELAIIGGAVTAIVQLFLQRGGQ